eukprot:1442333-Prymnesium_polylepis.1
MRYTLDQYFAEPGCDTHTAVCLLLWNALAADDPDEFCARVRPVFDAQRIERRVFTQVRPLVYSNILTTEKVYTVIFDPQQLSDLCQRTSTSTVLEFLGKIESIREYADRAR